jgi:diguanylate cyclase (GGDEF)-like protein
MPLDNALPREVQSLIAVPCITGLRTVVSAMLLLWVLLWPHAGRAAPTAPLVLAGDTAYLQVWPHVEVLRDPGRQMSLDDVRRAAPRFERPVTAYATLGLNKDAMWLRAALSVPEQDSGRWVLDFDYAPLNRLDVHVLDTRGRVVQQAVLGNLIPFAERAVRSRSHTMVLELPPGGSYELYVRVQTQGAMILPITLSKAAEFHARAIDKQMLQGLLSGLGLCLFFYSLAQWLAVRDVLFLKYAVLIGGGILFSIAQFGLGAQYLWGRSTWLELHVPGLSALVAATGTSLFVEQVLAGPGRRGWFSRMMFGVAAALMTVAAAFALDWIDVHAVSAVVGTLGLAPALLGLPGTLARARRGDPVGWYFVAAWTGYFIFTFVMVSVIKGQVPANVWTLHSFQAGATLDMLLFLRILGLRTLAVHAAAARATSERDALHSLAHTDPLTGLLNRRGFNAALADALPRASDGQLLAVYMLDLDGFKNVNDQHGHDVGDELLVAVAQRLRGQLRSSDVVARVGGDEFIVMTAGLHNDRQAQDLGRKLIDSFSYPFELKHERRCEVGLTVGYVLVPPDGDDPVALLKRADAAMYAGKQGGKSCLRRGEAALS